SPCSSRAPSGAGAGWKPRRPPPRSAGCGASGLLCETPFCNYLRRTPVGVRGPGAPGPPSKWSVGGESEREREIRGLAFLDGDLGGLGAELLVPRLDRVLARRDVLDLETAVGARGGEEGALRDHDVAHHPRMHVALQLDDIGVGRDGLGKGGGLGRLRLVEDGLRALVPVHVVEGRVRVADLDLLSRDGSLDAGAVEAAV